MREDTTKTSRLAVAASLLLVAALAGCAMDETAAFGPVNQCTTDAECAEQGGVCDEELGACVAVGGDVTDTLVFFISAPQGSGSSERRFEASAVADDQPFRFTIVETVLVRGLVDDQRDGLVALQASLTFRRQSEFNGLRPEPTYTETTPGIHIDDHEMPYNYEVRLVPGNYEVEVEPSQDGSGPVSHQSYYPLRQTFEVTADRSPVRQDLLYTEDTKVVSNLVLDPEGSPVGGVRVFAFDNATGRRISNVAVTQCLEPGDECGRFSLAVPDDTGNFSLRLRGSDTQPLLPTMERDYVADWGDDWFGDSDLDGDGRLDEREMDGEIRFPELADPVLYQTVVEGMNRDGEVRPLAGAMLEFSSVEAPDSSSNISMEASATTDTEGQIVALDGRGGSDGVGIWLLPATYRVLITPSADGEFATGEMFITVSPSGSDDPARESLAVGRRIMVNGSVATSDGVPVPQVRVEATGDEGRSFVTSTDEFGGFALYVDPGLYDLSFIPPERSLLAWTWQTAQNLFQDVTISANMGLGIPISGVVVREVSQLPVENALVESFVFRESDDETLLLRFGRIRTDDQGEFTVLVPGEAP